MNNGRHTHSSPPPARSMRVWHDRLWPILIGAALAGYRRAVQHPPLAELVRRHGCLDRRHAPDGPYAEICTTVESLGSYAELCCGEDWTEQHAAWIDGGIQIAALMGIRVADPARASEPATACPELDLVVGIDMAVRWIVEGMLSGLAWEERRI